MSFTAYQAQAPSTTYLPFVLPPFLSFFIKSLCLTIRFFLISLPKTFLLTPKGKYLMGIQSGTAGRGFTHGRSLDWQLSRKKRLVPIKFSVLLGSGPLESQHAFREGFSINKGLPGPVLTVTCSKKETTRTHSEGPRAKPGHDWVLCAIPIITTGHYKFFKLVVNVSEK